MFLFRELAGSFLSATRATDAEGRASDLCGFYDNTQKHRDKRNGEKRGRTAALVLADVVALLLAVVALPVAGDNRLPSVSVRKLLKLLSVVKLMMLCRVDLFGSPKERTAA